jgi:hypothetical protein
VYKSCGHDDKEEEEILAHIYSSEVHLQGVHRLLVGWCQVPNFRAPIDVESMVKPSTDAEVFSINDRREIESAKR